MASMANLSRPSSVGPRRMHRMTLSPQDAVQIYAAQRVSAEMDYDPVEMFAKLQQEALARGSFKGDRSSINSLDSLPSPRFSTSSYTSRYSTANSSPTTPTFPIRPRHAVPRAKAPIFKRLPQEVYDAILEQLEELHTDRLAPSCATCFMRDLTSLQRTSRAWDKAVRRRLYEKIIITGNDSSQQLKKYRVKSGSRLRLLRRTLRERRALANLVKELVVPDCEYPMYDSNGRINPPFEEYRELIASMVMVCPNLERLVGFYPSFNHEYDRLTHALSTRKKLKERVWMIAENKDVSYRSQVQLPPGLLDQLQVYQFLQYHAAWVELETLMLYAQEEAIIEEHIFVEMFQFLPSLQNLCMKNFDADDFTDRVLLTLPPLKCLRLENMSGVSDKGLSRWTATPAAQSLQSLSLIEQNLESLLTISKILASLPNLEKFTLVQTTFTPELPTELIVIQPIIASNSLKHLHWDIVSAGSESLSSVLDAKGINFKTVNTHLALSIMHSGFPNLQSLRAPSDSSPPGALQAVCRPTKDAQILLPADRYALPPKYRAPKAAMPEVLPTGNNLHSARVRAQSYMDVTAKSPKEFVRVIITDHSDSKPPSRNTVASRSSSKFSVSSSRYSTSTSGEPTAGQDPYNNVLEENKSFLATLSSIQGLKVQEFSLPSFMGRVQSSVGRFGPRPPKFNLKPDVPGYDNDGGVVGWNDLIRRSRPPPPPSHTPALQQTYSTTSLKSAVSEKNPTTTTAKPPKVRRATSSNAIPTSTGIRDGCIGSWNQLHSKGPDWWKHVERERKGVIVEARMLF